MITKVALLCLAMNVYHESRGEPLEGQYAVAHVTINRSIENRSNICKEVYRLNQFSWTRKKRKQPGANDEDWIRSLEVARDSLNKRDITSGSTYFFNPKVGNVQCITKGRKFVKRIGNHVFYSNIRRKDVARN